MSQSTRGVIPHWDRGRALLKGLIMLTYSSPVVCIPGAQTILWKIINCPSAQLLPGSQLFSMLEEKLRPEEADLWGSQCWGGEVGILTWPLQGQRPHTSAPFLCPSHISEFADKLWTNISWFLYLFPSTFKLLLPCLHFWFFWKHCVILDRFQKYFLWFKRVLSGMWRRISDGSARGQSRLLPVTLIRVLV